MERKATYHEIKNLIECSQDEALFLSAAELSKNDSSLESPFFVCSILTAIAMSDPESSSPTANSAGGGNGAPAAPPTTSGPPPNIQKLVASKRLQQAQAQVGEVVDIMRVNVEKVLERDQKISELDRRADDLQEGASQFQQHAVKLKRKYWWENIKMWIIIGVILLAVVIIVVITTSTR